MEIMYHGKHFNMSGWGILVQYVITSQAIYHLTASEVSIGSKAMFYEDHVHASTGNILWRKVQS